MLQKRDLHQTDSSANVDKIATKSCWRVLLNRLKRRTQTSRACSVLRAIDSTVALGYHADSQPFAAFVRFGQRWKGFRRETDRCAQINSAFSGGADAQRGERFTGFSTKAHNR
jgi:hypothetical protein